MAEPYVFLFEGFSGDNLYVYEDRIVIQHKGLLNVMAMGVHGDKTIFYRDLGSVQFKKCGCMPGQIQFSVVGGRESTGGYVAGTQDENTITFSDRNKNDEAEKITEYILKRMREVKETSSATVSAPSSADEIKKFKELLDMGIITHEEFQIKKEQLLGISRPTTETQAYNTPQIPNNIPNFIPSFMNAIEGLNSAEEIQNYILEFKKYYPNVFNSVVLENLSKTVWAESQYGNQKQWAINLIKQYFNIS